MIPLEKIYRVGGCVRDALLGRPPCDCDYVVVHSCVEEMVRAGFRPIGRDFPVFLHPQTQEEYALARTERQSGKGYHGFTFYTDSKVTIEEDLKRRDLTINAIAENLATHARIDPFQGEADLNNKILRHVSDAFAEDPVRVLRLARFCARFSDFSIAPETFLLCQKMVQDGELNYLVKERVFEEFKKGLMEQNPSKMLEFLWKIGAFHVFFKAILDCSTVKPEKFSILDIAAQRNLALPERVAVFCRIFSDDESSVRQMAQRFHFPKDCADAAILLAHFAVYENQFLQFGARDWVDFFQFLDIARRPKRFDSWLKTAQLFAPHLNKNLFYALFSCFLSVDGATIAQRWGTENIAQKIQSARIHALNHFLEERMHYAKKAQN